MPRNQALHSAARGPTKLGTLADFGVALEVQIIVLGLSEQNYNRYEQLYVSRAKRLSCTIVGVNRYIGGVEQSARSFSPALSSVPASFRQCTNTSSSPIHVRFRNRYTASTSGAVA